MVISSIKFGVMVSSMKFGVSQSLVLIVEICVAGFGLETQNFVLRRIYPFVVAVNFIIAMLSFQIRQFRRLYNHIKDDKYVIRRHCLNPLMTNFFFFFEGGRGRGVTVCKSSCCVYSLFPLVGKCLTINRALLAEVRRYGLYLGTLSPGPSRPVPVGTSAAA